MGAPKPSGPTAEQLKAQADAEKRASEAEQRTNEALSSTARASYGRRTGRRLLLAPGREDSQATLG